MIVLMRLVGSFANVVLDILCIKKLSVFKVSLKFMLYLIFVFCFVVGCIC